VTIACIAASAATLYLLVGIAKAKPLEAMHLLGWWPVKPLEFLKSFALVLLLYTGPLFEVVFIEKDLRGFRGWEQTVTTLSSWSGYRNYVAGPLTEEVIFRSVIIPLHLIAGISSSKIVFLTPLYFGIAHVHHLYEFKLTHPHTPWLPAILRSTIQFGYTTVFGWFASFLYLRTGSIYAGVLIHSFCNWGGLPRFWGRPHRRAEFTKTPVVPRRKYDGEMPHLKMEPHEVGNAWVVAYYVLLVVGAYAFYRGLWPLTESTQALTTFGSAKREP
jgi:prenyl protein peptidase